MPITQRVLFGSLEHLLPIILAIGFGFLVIVYSKKQTLKTQHLIFNILGVLVSGIMVLFHLYQIGFTTYNLQTDLPLFLCSFMGLFIVVFTVSKSYLLFEILLFWIILGTIQGVITPDIAIGFPSFDYFRYWIVHLGLILIILYAISVLKFKPTLKSVVKSFLVLQVYALILMAINYLLNSNYSYLNKKPISASVLDYLGDWPYYIIKVEVMLIPAFLIVYLPFYLFGKQSVKTR